MAAVQSTINLLSAELYTEASRQLAANNQASVNLCLSPVSIVYCTLLVYLGAHGSTKDNIGSALGFNQNFNGNSSTVVNAFSTALTSLNSTITSDYSLSIANGIFLEKTYSLLPAYLDATTNRLGAGVIMEDFINNPDAGRIEINNWVANRTQQKILDLLAKGSLDGNTRIVLANAVYFKAAWTTPFSALATPSPFQNLDGSTVQVNMMVEQFRSINYAELQAGSPSVAVQYVEIPYNGTQASFLIFLPQASGFNSLEKALSSDLISMAASSATSKTVEVTMPIFRTESQFDAKDLLQKLGITIAFDSTQADLSEMSPQALSPRLFVSSGIHKTFMDVNVNGTEAAAATALGISMASAPSNVVDFTVNRPFIYAIRHNPTNLLLFIGSVKTLPTAGSATTTNLTTTAPPPKLTPTSKAGPKPTPY